MSEKNQDQPKVVQNKIKDLLNKSVGYFVGQVLLWIFFLPVMIILVPCGLYWKWGI